MSINVTGIAPNFAIQEQQLRTKAPGSQAGPDFQQVLKERLQQANQEVKAADQAVEEMIQTQGANLHETMIALEKADIAVRLTTKVGEKLVRAYKEVSQIQV